MKTNKDARITKVRHKQETDQQTKRILLTAQTNHRRTEGERGRERGKEREREGEREPLCRLYLSPTDAFRVDAVDVNESIFFSKTYFYNLPSCLCFRFIIFCSHR